MLAVKLGDDIEARLEELARRTGRSKTHYVREAVLEHLDDIEDVAYAEEAVRRLATSDDTVPAEEVFRSLGL